MLHAITHGITCSLPAYHVYASPERFRSGPSSSTVTAAAAAADTSPVSISPPYLPYLSREAGAPETAQSDGESQTIDTDEVEAAEDADNSEDWWMRV